MDDSADEQLARQAQAGDRQALERLLTRHRQVVFAMTVRITGNRTDALDATQETLLRVFRFLHRYQPDRPFLPWLRTIAVRAALDQIKRRKRHVAAELVQETLVDASQDPHRDLVGSELADRVGLAVAGLSPAQRAAFVCKELSGMDTATTARAMGCRKSTVRWHLFEARKKLARQLADHLRGES